MTELRDHLTELLDLVDGSLLVGRVRGGECYVMVDHGDLGIYFLENAEASALTASDRQHQSLVGEAFHLNGSCVENDKDGDNVFTTFDDKNHYLMGGTGKYKGITETRAPSRRSWRLQLSCRSLRVKAATQDARRWRSRFAE